MAGGEEKKKDRKTWKSRSEEKVVGFSSASLFPARKREAVTQDGTRGIEHLNPGSRYHQRLGGQARPRVPSGYIHVKYEEHKARSLNPPPKFEPRLSIFETPIEKAAIL